MFMNLIKSFLWVSYDTETLRNPEFYLRKRKEKGKKQPHLPPTFFQFSDKQFNSTRPMILNSSFTVNKCLVHLSKH